MDQNGSLTNMAGVNAPDKKIFKRTRHVAEGNYRCRAGEDQPQRKSFGLEA